MVSGSEFCKISPECNGFMRFASRFVAPAPATLTTVRLPHRSLADVVDHDVGVRTRAFLSSMRKPSVLVILLTVFIDLIGFGIVVPLVPAYSRHFGAEGISSSASSSPRSRRCSLFSPRSGDSYPTRYGRRPILLISTAGAAASYVLFAFVPGAEAHGRALDDGLFPDAGRVLSAAILPWPRPTSPTSPRRKSFQQMGLIGMAFGLGFIFGPFIGGKSLQLWGSTGPVGWRPPFAL